MTSELPPNHSLSPGISDHYGFFLIGKGDPGKDCGEVIPLMSCQSCMKAHFVSKQCGKKGCPNCWGTWLHKHTAIASIKLLANRTIRRNERKRLVHIILSSDELITPDNYHRMREEARSYLSAKSNYPLTGVLVFHAYRPSGRYWKERGIEKREQDDDSLDDLKKWEWIRAKEDWWTYVKYSPHFHYIGYVGWLSAPEIGEGWIYKTMMRNGKVSTLNGKRIDVFKVVHYILSHTVDRATPLDSYEFFDDTQPTKITEPESAYFHAYSYTGEISNREGRTIEEEKYYAKMDREKKARSRCKVCGGALWNMKANMNAFLKTWCHIIHPEGLNFNEMRKVIFATRMIFKDVWLNALQCVDLIEGTGPPPPNYANFMVGGLGPAAPSKNFGPDHEQDT